MNRPSPFIYLFVLPALAIYAVFVLYPFAETVRLSFYDWTGFKEPVFVGIKNYYAGKSPESATSLYNDLYLRRALINNVLFWLMTLVTEVAAGLGLAALLARAGRGTGVYRLFLSAPLLVALVASGVLWRQFLMRDGLLNHGLDAMGLGAHARDWLDPKIAVGAISVISGWAYAGFYMLILYAGIERIPVDLREAARIDGAGEWSIFTKIELPLLRPVLAVCVLLCSTGAFRAFDLFFVLLGRAPNRYGEVASTWLVKNAFTFKSFGYASAIATLVVVLVMSLAAILSAWASKERDYEF